MKSETNLKKTSNQEVHLAFLPLVSLVLILWIVYRSIFKFSVLFDETIGKALFFGIPVWAYLNISNTKEILDSFSFEKLRRGLLLGLAVGGVFGFSITIINFMKRGGNVIPSPYYMSDRFWLEFFLSIFTAFWETLFFYSFIMIVIKKKFSKIPLFLQILLTAFIFLVFHIPNTIIRATDPNTISFQAMLLFLFALGQAYLFATEKNSFALILSHSIWGMALLIHGLN